MEEKNSNSVLNEVLNVVRKMNKRLEKAEESKRTSNWKNMNRKKKINKTQI